MSLKHWQLINGLGNDYIGWGGEDDDLYHRLRQNGLLYQNRNKADAAPVPRRPPKGNGVFRTISQKAEHHEQKKTHNQYWKTLELLKEMHENSERWKFDGMSDVYYTITNRTTTEPGMGFQQYHHIKAIPQKTQDGVVHYRKDKNGTPEGPPVAPLEFVHVPYTGGQALTKAAASANIVWGACHYGTFEEWNCPKQGSGDFQHSPIQFKASFHQAQRPWHIPLMRFLENPMEGTKRFTVVRHPYSRAISFYRYTYDAQHGYPHGFKYHELVQDKSHPPLAVAEYLREREHPAKLNAFLQDFFIRQHHPHKPDAAELLPQVVFVYHRGLRYVHHVLHYEFLQRDFKSLLGKYDMTGIIELPPPNRKRKRRKQKLKSYEEKRIPRPTWTFKSLFRPLYNFVGYRQEQDSSVVDMSLAEIEDEYLLGAQDLANETIAMLNTHFELDFRKFHYAKINVNATSEAYWSPIQSIPRTSGVAEQQANRDNALNNAKGIRGGAAPPPAASAASSDAVGSKTQTSAKNATPNPQNMQTLADVVKNNQQELEKQDDKGGEGDEDEDVEKVDLDNADLDDKTAEKKKTLPDNTNDSLARLKRQENDVKGLQKDRAEPRLA